MFKEITSLQNPIIKRILLLKDKAKQRNIEGVFVIEGQRELGLAIKGGYVIQSLLFEPNLFSTVHDLNHNYLPEVSSDWSDYCKIKYNTIPRVLDRHRNKTNVVSHYRFIEKIHFSL